MAEAIGYQADLSGADAMYGEEEQQEHPVDFLTRLSESDNIAEELNEEDLRTYAHMLIEEIDADKGSMSEWMQGVERGMKLADSKIEEKSFPWPGASNVKLPLIQTSVLKFAAKSYAKLLSGKGWVKAERPGLMHPDPETEAQTKARVKRVCDFMDYQLRHEVPGWERGFDQLLHMLPWVGCLHRKTVFDVGAQECRVTLVMPDKLYVNNGTTEENFKYARFTEKLMISQNQYHEMVQRGYYLPLDFDDNESSDHPRTDNMREFYESHCWLDLDDDGYKEPYIVTIHMQSHRITRIAARFDSDNINFNQQTGDIQSIDPDQHFTKYEFTPAPNGSYWSEGWGHQCGGMNEAANTIVNQLIDAGTLQNTNPGAVDERVRSMDGGEKPFRIGERQRVRGIPGRPLRDSFHDFNVAGPSPVLFNALNLIDEKVTRLASTPDQVAGDTASTAPVTTRIEEAERVNNGIDKRIYLSMSDEYTKLYHLNRRYLDPQKYAQVLNLPVQDAGQAAQITAQDFNADDFDVMPTANPETSSKTMRMVQAEFLKQASAEAAAVGIAVNLEAVFIEGLEAAGVENPQRFLKQPTPEDQAAAEMQAAAQEASTELEIERQAQEVDKLTTENELLRAQIITEIEQPDKVEAETAKLEAEAKMAAKPQPAQPSTNKS